MINLSSDSWMSFSVLSRSLEKLQPSLASNSSLRLSSSERIKLFMKNFQSHHQLQSNLSHRREMKRLLMSHQPKKKERRNLLPSSQKTSSGPSPIETPRTCLNSTWAARVWTLYTKWKTLLTSMSIKLKLFPSALTNSVVDSRTKTILTSSCISK